MNRRLGGDASLNAPIREDGDSGEWQDWLVDEIPDQETTCSPRARSSITAARRCRDALTVLNERERRIFEARRLAEEPITLEELADEFGVSRERVRQIEVRAFEKVQKAVKNRVAAMEAPTGCAAADRGALTAKLVENRTGGAASAAGFFCGSEHRVTVCLHPGRRSIEAGAPGNDDAATKSAPAVEGCMANASVPGAS